MALAEPRLGANDFRKKRFRCLITVEDIIFTAFLVVDHKLESKPRALWPFRLRRIGAVTDHVSRIVFVIHGPLLLFSRCRIGAYLAGRNPCTDEGFHHLDPGDDAVDHGHTGLLCQPNGQVGHTSTA